MKTSSFAKLAGFSTFMRSFALLSGLVLALVVGVAPAFAQDAPPSINFSFGDTPTETPPSLNAIPKTPVTPPPSIVAPPIVTPPVVTPPVVKPPVVTPPVTTPVTTPVVTDYYLGGSSIEQPQRPVAPQKKMPETGPEMLYMIVPALMGSTGYKLYRRKKLNK